ncbi:unnamed protein product [Orchesella dallaii]|uniref:Checkpoint protein n=1 Tax=Orchesella dallaii TaxID=48710 RepID=A0ABP1S9A6_9HEXA
MKFRAKADDLMCIRTFARLLTALSQCSRNFVLRITPDKLCFILSNKEVAAATRALLAWAEVPKQSTFVEYAMEGLSTEDNEIFLEIAPEKIAGCLSILKSTNSVEMLKIKLTKKVVPCLTFEIEFPGVAPNNTCVHDVPVIVIQKMFWSHYTNLEIPAEFDLSIDIPEMQMVRVAMERMKNLGPRLLVKASSAGKLVFSAENSNAKVTIKFPDGRLLDHSAVRGFRESEQQLGEDAEVREFCVEVDMKTVYHTITPDLHKPSQSICSLIHSRLLHLYFEYGDITLQYVLPSIIGDNPI